MNWSGWPWDRVIILFTGLALLMLALQVTLFHLRQNFRHWTMLLPVIATPILGLLAIIIAFFNVSFLRTIWVALLAVTGLAGLVGFFLHFEGVGERVDGYRFHNFLVGPPITLPLMITALSVLGAIAIYWRW